MPVSLQSLSVYQFKNYFEKEIRFTERIIGICGRNGVGKTNLLDAIHYLCFTKSYFSRLDVVNVHKGSEGFRIAGEFGLNGENESAVCILRENGKKEFNINGVAYTKFSSHIGRYPCVIIAPDDIQLILGTGEDRRKFIDTILSQFDPVYLQSLIKYTRILQQRNVFLRNYAESYSRDVSLLDVLDGQLTVEGDLIAQTRARFMIRFLPLVRQYYADISKSNEDVSLFYDSELEYRNMKEILDSNRQKDLHIGRTSGGIHRDDINFLINEQPFKSIASQGQRKSLLFALRLAEMEILKSQKSLSPILLLDDVFEKLDEERLQNLLHRVCSDEDAQIFITDTNCARLDAQLRVLGHPFQSIQLP